MNMKRCRKCGETKSVEEFSRNRGRKDGLDNRCKSCMKAYGKVYREQNREKISAKKKAYHEQNRERVLACQKAYREQNLEKLAAWREENRERLKASYRVRHAKARLKTLDALEALPALPTDEQVILSLSAVNTCDTSPVCKLADILLALAHCGAEEHEAKAEILSELTPEWIKHQRDYQLKTIKEYNDAYPEYATA